MTSTLHDDNRSDSYWDTHRREIIILSIFVYILAKRIANKNSKIADVGCGPANKLASIFPDHKYLYAYDQKCHQQ